MRRGLRPPSGLLWGHGSSLPALFNIRQLEPEVRCLFVCLFVLTTPSMLAVVVLPQGRLCQGATKSVFIFIFSLLSAQASRVRVYFTPTMHITLAHLVSSAFPFRTILEPAEATAISRWGSGSAVGEV